jgi:hypothetical protein
VSTSILLVASQLLVLRVSFTVAFDTSYPPFVRNGRPSSANVFAAGQGFDDSSSRTQQGLPIKTYDSKALQPRKDVIDADAAMREFFDGVALEWIPLFQQLTQTNVPGLANSAAGTDSDKDRGVFEFHALTTPWKELPGIPTLESHRTMLATFLDQVQASLVAIPVDESTKEDENDLHFLEEGRRMLVCGRFHVVEYHSPTNRLDNFEAVFGTCWSEVYQLVKVGEQNSGSVILVPDCQNLDDLRRFVDVNLQRPLQWMGLDSIFEVTSLQRGFPAIRVIYKLSDMPVPDVSSDQSQNDD